VSNRRPPTANKFSTQDTFSNTWLACSSYNLYSWTTTYNLGNKDKPWRLW